jgi:hypothetical protein
MVLDYSTGKIYKLTTPHGSDVYYGTTTLPLNIVLSTCKNKYKNYSNGKTTMCLEYYKLFEYAMDDVVIELVENVCTDKKSTLKKSLERYKKSPVKNLGIRKMVNCECGAIYYKCHESEHLRTKRHGDIMAGIWVEPVKENRFIWGIE